MRGDMRLAVIHPTRAQIPHREVIRANFLMPGPHWQEVANFLCDAEPELMAERKRELEAKVAAEALPAAATVARRHAPRVGASIGCQTSSPQNSSALALTPADVYVLSGNWLTHARWSCSATSAS